MNMKLGTCKSKFWRVSSVILTNLECKGDWQDWSCLDHCWSCWLAPYYLMNQSLLFLLPFLWPRYMELASVFLPLLWNNEGLMWKKRWCTLSENMKWLFCSYNTTCLQFQTSSILKLDRNFFDCWNTFW